MFVVTAAGSSVTPGTSASPRASDARERVVVGEPLDVVVERVQRARGDDARLAHRAADICL